MSGNNIIIYNLNKITIILSFRNAASEVLNNRNHILQKLKNLSKKSLRLSLKLTMSTMQHF